MNKIWSLKEISKDSGHSEAYLRVKLARNDSFEKFKATKKKDPVTGRIYWKDEDYKDFREGIKKD